jgi:hypothetical protein
MKTAYLLLLLIAIVITAIVLQKIASSQPEGFKNVLTSLPVLKTCPHKMKSFIDGKSNNTYCCDSAVDGNICQGRKVCVMTPGIKDTASCAQYLLDYTNKMSEKHCFDSMDKYYEDDSQVPAISGCATQVNEGFSAPTPGSASCRIYPTQKDNQYKFDSCENRKMVHIAENGSFCKSINCTSVLTAGNGRNVAWVNANYMTQDGNAPVLTSCETKESTIRHITYGYGDYYANEPTMGPKTGDELAKAMVQVNEGTYPGMCPMAAPDTPRTIPLERLQAMFEKAGCTRKLIEGNVGWWRGRNSLTDIQNDMNAYGSITKGCSGSTGQHEFCSPGKCAQCNKKARYISVKGPGYIQISQIVAKDKNGNNVARGGGTWASEPWSPESKKEYVTDGTEAVREYPNIYHSKSNAADTYIYIQFPPSCISEIILYGRNSYESQHAGKTIMIVTENGEALWTAQTNSDKIQKFTIPQNIYA